MAPLTYYVKCVNILKYFLLNKVLCSSVFIVLANILNQHKILYGHYTTSVDLYVHLLTRFCYGLDLSLILTFI